jgi:WD40 repeat protein
MSVHPNASRSAEKHAIACGWARTGPPRRPPGTGVRPLTVLVVTLAMLTGLVAVVPTAAAAPAAMPLQVDFGASSSTPATGFVLDHGQAYGPRSGAGQGQGLTYGWVADGTSTPLDLTSSGRTRTGTGLSDVKVTTFMHLQLDPAQPGAWEAEVAGGWYTVSVGLGDAAANYNSTHTVTAEGQQVVAPYTPTAPDRLRAGTVTVQVTDGRLTIRPEGGSNVKITYLTVVEAASPEAPAFPVKVDFGAQASSPADGNVLDYGEPYARRSGAEYGWVAEGTTNPVNLVGNGRQRTASGLADPRQGNFIHMQALTGASGNTTKSDWAMAVPNGDYRVTVGTGDAANVYDSSHALSVEGQTAIAAYTPTFASKFRIGVVDVEVTDGVLTVSALGGNNTKIDFVEIEQWDEPPAATMPLKVDFGATNTVPADGYRLDSGTAYGPRSGGYSYGWVQQGTSTALDVTANGRQRTGTTTTDPRQMSLVMMQAPSGVSTPAAWELAVPEGTYQVTVGVGDAANVYDSQHAINVEGTAAIAPFTPTANNRFATATVSVPVTDGRLTVDAVGGANSKITFADIDVVDTTRPRAASVTPANNATDVVRDVSVTTELTLTNGAINPNTVTTDAVRLIKVADGSAVPASVNTSGGGDVLVLTPLAPLEANTGYRYKITDGVQDVTGKAFVPFESTFTTGTLLSGTGIEGVAFAQETTVAQNHMFTSVTVGPDHKLYAATLNGYLFRYDIATDGSLSNEQQINTVRTMNSDQNRTIVGLTFDPASTADNLILWVTDNFMYVGNDNVPDWSSKLVRLTGADLENGENVLVNLPRSAHDHEANSIAFGPDGALYFSMGSNTGMGHQDVAWANRPEVQLSGAVLRLDTSALPGELPLDVKTADGGGSYDPYAAGAPLTLYATGVRNAYDLLWHSNGSLYAPTNGSAAGANIPTVPTTLPASCQSRIDSATNGAYSYDGPSFATIMYNPVAQTDFIHRVEQGGYYGHPNPSRCEYISYGGNPTGGTDPWQESQYPVGVQPDRNFRADDVYDAGLHASANGTIEYRGDAFGGKLAGKILVVRYSAGKDIEVVDPSGPDGRVVGITTGVTGFTGFDEPLDVVEDTAGTGVLYVTELGGQSIKLLRPAA